MRFERKTAWPTLAVTVLLVAGCVGAPGEAPGLTADDREDAIVAALFHQMEDAEPYCLRVLGKPPSRSLERKLHAVGHEQLDLCAGEGEIRITAVEAKPDGTIAVDYESYGGPLSVFGIRFFVRRDEAGNMAVVRDVGTIET